MFNKMVLELFFNDDLQVNVVKKSLFLSNYITVKQPLYLVLLSCTTRTLYHLGNLMLR